MKKEKPKQVKYELKEQRYMKKVMTPQEAYDKGLFQLANILETDRRIREALGMPSLYEHIRQDSSKGRPKKDN